MTKNDIEYYDQSLPEDYKIANQNIDLLLPKKNQSSTLEKLFKTLNPLEKDFNFDSTTKISYKFSPSLSNFKRSKLELKFDKKFIEDDVEVTVKVNGEIFNLNSKKGEADFSANFTATKRF